MAKRKTKRRNPVSGGVRLTDADLAFLASVKKVRTQGKRKGEYHYPFAGALTKSRRRGRITRLTQKELYAAALAGGGWRPQQLLTTAPKPSVVRKGLMGIAKSIRRAIVESKTTKPKGLPRADVAPKPAPSPYQGHRVFRRLSKTAQTSMVKVLRHFAKKPRYVVKYHSEAGKMGPGVTATYSPRHTCPRGCSFYNDCYANEKNVKSIWLKGSLGLIGHPWGVFIKKLRASPDPNVRINIAGDLPGDGDTINRRKAYQLADAASKGGTRTAWTYTHYPITKENLHTIHGMRRLGLQVNLSADSLKDADRKAQTGLDVAVVIPPDETAYKTPRGRIIKRCPAIMTSLANKVRPGAAEHITCSSCGTKGGGKFHGPHKSSNIMCARMDRQYIIGFPAHGALEKEGAIQSALEGSGIDRVNPKRARRRNMTATRASAARARLERLAQLEKLMPPSKARSQARRAR